MSGFILEKPNLLSVKAFVYSASDDDISLAKNILQKMELSPGEIIDLRSLAPKIEPTEVLYALAFGARAHSRSRQIYPSLSILQLPELRLLRKEGGEEAARSEAFGKLKSLKGVPGLPNEAKPAPNNTQSSIQNLPPILERGNLNKLYESLIQKGIKEWRGITRDDRSIKITLNSEPTSSDADIILTFQELLVILETISIFDLQGVTIVKTDRANSSSSSETINKGDS